MFVESASKKSTDRHVIVVGAGLAGLSAALEAFNKSAKVRAFKTGYTLGDVDSRESYSLLHR